MTQPQDAAAVLMIRPVRFQANDQTMATNEFQHLDDRLSVAETQRRAAAEHEALVQVLRREGVKVCVFDDTPEPHKPDAIFPNNWVSFHASGTVLLYPKLAENRRAERRLDIIQSLAEDYGFQINQTIDLSPHELNGRFLEGTGSLVLDRVNRIAYACLSMRTHRTPVEEFGRLVDYRTFTFEAFGPTGQPVYHTNVMMAIGEGLAVLCAEAVRDEQRRRELIESLEGNGREVMLISMEQMMQYAGNVLQMRTAAGDKLLAMSARAERSLTAAQRATVARPARIVSSPVDTIEDCSGGSVRCMLAAIHLPHPDIVRPVPTT
jgi:hypothetical protein